MTDDRDEERSFYMVSYRGSEAAGSAILFFKDPRMNEKKIIRIQKFVNDAIGSTGIITGISFLARCTMNQWQEGVTDEDRLEYQNVENHSIN